MTTFREYFKEFNPETEQAILKVVEHENATNLLDNSPDSAIKMVREMFGAEEPDAVIALKMICTPLYEEGFDLWHSIINDTDKHLKQ